MTTPGTPTPKPKHTARTVAGVVVGVALLVCCGTAITSIVDSSSSDSSSSDSGSASDNSVNTTPTGPSDDQVRQDALAYKVCPGKEGDTLQNMIAYTFTIAHDEVGAARVVERSGDHAHIGVPYIENGQDQETVFDYNLTTGQVVGVDGLAVKILDDLKAECPA